MADLVEALKKMARGGLCGSCLHACRIESDKGSVFIRCELSLVDPTFAKYPRLPVLTCDGYKPKEAIRQ